ncbi:Maf-like protein [Lentisphaera araneosa HTCC2155]|uniref:Maf-like protein n=1 Tax=Lentisphaera araneosa HTCC2155 TaxID=313628 RepID=A6DTS1_9BACT|nr:hypothetical protein [Lentisphaera araneosa]EDM24942.1 Maf-like protein [Lentisphaera araneosa HTCC2155]
MRGMLYILLGLCLVFVSCKQEVQKNQQVVAQEPSSNQSTDEESVKLQKFYEYVLLGRHKEALALVNSLDLGPDFTVKDKTYKALFNEFDLKDDFYEDSKFTELDYFYWMQSLLFKRQVEKMKASLKEGEDPIRKLYDLVNTQVAAKGEGPDRAAFPIQIWQRGFGVCDRQSWVMTELAYQLGADVYIVYFIEEDTGISKHTICQVRYKGRDYLIDPLYEKFLVDFHWNDLTEEKAAEIWQDHPYLADDIKKAEILLPSMPHDFAKRHQLLSEKLIHVVPQESLFRFGESPIKRSKRWPYKKGQDYFYWDYPHRLMTGMTVYRQFYSKGVSPK